MPGVHRLGLATCYKIPICFMLKSWHRSVGIFAAVFLLLLTVTGTLLMQTDDLELDSRYVNNERLLDWYGIHPAPPPISFSVDGHWITQLGSRIYFDTRILPQIDGRLIGVIAVGDELLIGTTSSLVLVTTNGIIAEKLGPESNVPTGQTHLGHALSAKVLLRSPSGQFIFDPESGLIKADATTQALAWSGSGSVPQSVLEVINQDYRGAGLSLERIVLDLHTGRLFGSLGVVMINLASIALLILIISGAILWWVRAR